MNKNKDKSKRGSDARNKRRVQDERTKRSEDERTTTTSEGGDDELVGGALRRARAVGKLQAACEQGSVTAVDGRIYSNARRTQTKNV